MKLDLKGFIFINEKTDKLCYILFEDDAWQESMFKRKDKSSDLILIKEGNEKERGA